MKYSCPFPRPTTTSAVSVMIEPATILAPSQHLCLSQAYHNLNYFSQHKVPDKRHFIGGDHFCKVDGLHHDLRGGRGGSGGH